MINDTLMNNLHVLTEKDIDKKRFQRFTQGIETLRKDYPEIEGLWWISENTCDGGTQILVKSSLPVKTLDRIELNGLLAKMFDAEIIYDYDRDLVNENGMVKSGAVIKEWLSEGKIFTLYRKEV